MKTMESTESAVFNALCDNGGNMSFNELMQDTGLDGERLSSIVRSLITNGQVLLRVNPLSVIANPCKSRAEVIYNRFMDLLSKHFREERNVTFYASQLCVTPKYLSAVVKEYSGKSPYRWIEEIVMDEICRLLRFSDGIYQGDMLCVEFPQCFLLREIREEAYGIVSAPISEKRGIELFFYHRGHRGAQSFFNKNIFSVLLCVLCGENLIILTPKKQRRMRRLR